MLYRMLEQYHAHSSPTMTATDLALAAYFRIALNPRCISDSGGRDVAAPAVREGAAEASALMTLLSAGTEDAEEERRAPDEGRPPAARPSEGAAISATAEDARSSLRKVGRLAPEEGRPTGPFPPEGAAATVDVRAASSPARGERAAPEDGRPSGLPSSPEDSSALARRAACSPA